MAPMSKEKPAKKPKPKDRGPTLHMRLDENEDAALEAFRAAQRVAPDRSAVGLTALHEFLAREGFWPWPKPPEKT